MIHRGMFNFFEVKYLLLDIFSMHLAAQILMRSNYYYYNNNTWNYIEWGNLYNLHVCLLPVFYQNCIISNCMWDFSIINIYFQRKVWTPGVADLDGFYHPGERDSEKDNNCCWTDISIPWVEVISSNPEDDPVVQGVEIPVNNNSPLQDLIHLDNHLLSRFGCGREH